MQLILCTLLISYQALAQDSQNHWTVEDRAKTLDMYATEAMGNEETAKVERALILYFQVFPSDFSTFQQVFGYLRDGRGRFLAKPPVNHTLVGILPKLKTTIPTKEYYDKMLSVGVGGDWDADEVSYLQHHLREIVAENVPLSVEVLRKHKAMEIISFWYYLYDGPHPDHPINREHYNNLHHSINDLDPRIAELLKQAYEQLLSKYDDHGH